VSARLDCVAGIQARMSSTRLPGKVLAEIAGRPLIEHVYERTRMAALLDGTFVLTTSDPSDDPLVEFLEARGIPYRRGSLTDVRSRYVDLAREFDARFVVRVTGDVPLVEPDFIDLQLGALRAFDVDLVRVGNDPEGAGAGTLGGQSAFSRRALEASLASTDPRDVEHVSAFFLAQAAAPLKAVEIEVDSIYLQPGLRLCVDEPADLELVRRLWERVDLAGDGRFPLERALAWLVEHPEVRDHNRHVSESADNQALRELTRARASGAALAGGGSASR
jgi:spore coat polysaccharide biosynthesis protein SpsF